MDYRAAWRRAPWLLPFPVIGLLLTIYGIYGTFARSSAAICFVPGILVLLLHHFLAQRANRA
jgi:hypothetical protein